MKISELPRTGRYRLRVGRVVGRAIQWGPWREAEVYAIKQHGTFRVSKRTFRPGVAVVTTQYSPNYRVAYDYVWPTQGYPWGYFILNGECLEVTGLSPG